ncbi:MarR family winged helix-turn-helix transcriptional regulator [Actinorugispora endophytica]|uniref:MarR family transcriptional regulator n=1 Tax=Actinorugispora endophytica TaxID=1605990 RepID=A0A4R6V2Y9_9ACTN|nr:MarR family transcriptional regulator [Actinorugispora endophytica]TDQ54312.1 MarR family transcriptional regulator [Actinorugispora endophytica]
MNADRDAPPGPMGQRELAAMLRTLAWTVQRLVPETAGLEPLPITELVVLRNVLDSPGVTVTRLARDLGMRQSNTSAAVRGLVERGLVARESSPTDRRVTRLVPTEKSLAESEHIDTVWSGTIQTAMARLSHEQVAAIESAGSALQALGQALHAEQTESRPRR